MKRLRLNRRTFVQSLAAAVAPWLRAADNRLLKLLWNGPAELDRVEIYQ
jgi:hypothetical protein